MDASELEALLTEFAEKLKEPASEDLEQAANEFGIRQGVELKPFAIKFFKAGAEWQKEQMMKDAVEGTICKDEYAEEAPFYYIASKNFDLQDLMMIGDS